MQRTLAGSQVSHSPSLHLFLGTGHLPAALTRTSLPDLAVLALISPPPLRFPSPVTQGTLYLGVQGYHAGTVFSILFSRGLPPSMVPGSPGSEIPFFSTSHVQPFPGPAHSLCYQYLPIYSWSFILNSRLIVSSLCVLVIAFLPSCLESPDLCRLFLTHSCQLNQKESSSCRSHNLWLPQRGLDVLSVPPCPIRLTSLFCRLFP